MNHSCLTESTLAALTDGVLDAAERAAVEEHIDGCGDCRELVSEIGRLAAGERDTPLSLDRYEVGAVAAVGGMGVVYEAYDRKLRRKVALKLLRADGHGDLLAEARALAAVSHPNVVAVYDVGTIDDCVFMAMEYLDSAPFDRWLTARRRSAREILELMQAAGRGLAAAHDAGLVHRDFKPRNVVIASDGRVRVVDFGLAAPPDSASREELAGTPGYIPPEVYAGTRATARADQYSFCVVLRDALNGRRIPRRIRRAIARGVHPDPSARHRDMHTLVGQLRLPTRRGHAIAALVTVACVGAAASVGGYATADGQPIAHAPSPATATALVDEPAPPPSSLDKVLRGSAAPIAFYEQLFDRNQAAPLSRHAERGAAAIESATGGCASTRVHGDTLQVAADECRLGRFPLSGAALIHYRRTADGVRAHLDVDRFELGGLRLETDASATLDRGVIRITAQGTGTGPRGVPFSFTRESRVERTGDDCLRRDGTWTTRALGRTWSGSVRNWKRCAGVCARAEEIRFGGGGADDLRLRLSSDGTIEWRRGSQSGRTRRACSPPA